MSFSVLARGGVRGEKEKATAAERSGGLWAGHHLHIVHVVLL